MLKIINDLCWKWVMIYAENEQWFMLEMGNDLQVS